VAPSVFIPTAEATGSIGAISDLVLRTVADELAQWTAQRLFPPDARISVNISPAEFNRREFLDRLAKTIAETALDPHRLELEITEALLVEDLRSAADRLRQLDSWGVRVAIDDFGTGYSSLSYLHSLPLHTLKIDRRFVGDLHDERSGTITRTIVSLAHNLGVTAVAEGVETELQRRLLTEAGCDSAQGFLIAPPLPGTAFRRFLSELPDGLAVG
jgi:EAL domain-containing protein (putative c-di-GMP-specific phosphodiesterase class I)